MNFQVFVSLSRQHQFYILCDTRANPLNLFASNECVSLMLAPPYDSYDLVVLIFLSFFFVRIQFVYIYHISILYGWHFLRNTITQADVKSS